VLDDWFYFLPENYFYGNGKELYIEYKDNNEMVYEINEDLDIGVVNVPFYVKIGWRWTLIVLFVGLLFFGKKIKKMI